MVETFLVSSLRLIFFHFCPLTIYLSTIASDKATGDLCTNLDMMPQFQNDRHATAFLVFLVSFQQLKCDHCGRMDTNSSCGILKLYCLRYRGTRRFSFNSTGSCNVFLMVNNGHQTI